ncbi:hypothetical protein A8B78_12075 [Jannaschia sp. EhC01]|nr:hypothetical protein A8B78_12075 [Jannaschia sp. EhC01]
MELFADPWTLIGLIAALGFAGMAIGFLAGLFGVGGGAISVPIFFDIFGGLGYDPEVAMPLAVGTSLAVIVPTSISSARGHYAKGALDAEILRTWAVPILLGVVIGAIVARFASPVVFQAVFAIIASIVALKLLTGGKGWQLGDSLPGLFAMRLAGGVIGLVSAIMGIGGGAISNLFMTLFGTPIHRAIATSAGVGVLISVPGAIGYVLAGLGQPGLPPGSLGFVSLVAFALTIPTSLVTTRFGVALAHGLSGRTLQIAFGCFLILVVLRFLWAIVSG